jgi:anti-anti-sigma regulatory factor
MLRVPDRSMGRRSARKWRGSAHTGNRFPRTGSVSVPIYVQKVLSESGMTRRVQLGPRKATALALLPSEERTVPVELVVVDPESSPPVHASAIDDRVIVTATGPLDRTTIDDLQLALDELLVSGDREIWIDLNDVTLVDFAALGALRDVQRAFANHRRRVVVIAGPGPALRNLQAAGLDKDFVIVADRDGAL